MALSSMTGFARGHGVSGAYSWAWELKSVNAKGFDLRLRLPPGWDAVEGAAAGTAAPCCKPSCPRACVPSPRCGRMGVPQSSGPRGVTEARRRDGARGPRDDGLDSPPPRRPIRAAGASGA